MKTLVATHRPRTGVPRWARLAPGAAVAITIGCLATTAHASPGQEVVSLRQTDAATLGQTLAGDNVTVTGATFTGDAVQGGTFADLAFGAIAPSTGVVLSTGSVIEADPTSDDDTDFTLSSVLGPNQSLTTTGDLGGAGDEFLTGLFGATTYDAAVLSIDVVPAGQTLTLEYVFGSEEYASWSAQEGYADAFAIWVGGVPCSVVPGSVALVGTQTVNPDLNPELYVANFAGIDPGAVGYDTEMNGFTQTFVCSAAVTPGQATTVRIAVADTADGQLDSSVLLAAGTLSSAGVPAAVPTTAPPTPTVAPVAARATVVARPTSRGGLATTGSDILGVVAVAGGLLAAGTATWWIARHVRARGAREI